MLCQIFDGAKAEFFRTLNQVVGPLVKAGVGSPARCPTGAIVVETKGRKTARILNVVLLATVIGDLVLVGTVRNRSNWIRNLAHAPEVRYWIHGNPQDATAFVLAPGVAPSRETELSPLAMAVAGSLTPLVHLFGIAFAILSPAAPRPGC